MAVGTVDRTPYQVAEQVAFEAMNTVNHAIAHLVDAIADLIECDGWAGEGIRSVEHWVAWKAAVAPRRAERLCAIARRREDLPACWALFRDGRLTEDVMGRVAGVVPAERDAEIARLAPSLMVGQLDRILRSCPENPDGTPKERTHPRQRTMGAVHHRDGWITGSFCLPPEEAPLTLQALGAARDAEFRDRRGVDEDTDLDDISEQALRPGVSWADAFVRLCGEGLDALDRSSDQSGVAGDRHHLVLHRDVTAAGLGPAQVHLGPRLPDSVARFFGCDARVTTMTYVDGRLVGIHPQQRTVARPLRRAIERRDQGCVHPLCQAKRWLHVHHIWHWEDGGPTIPSNLCCLCPAHHRQLHAGEFTIEGDPEVGGLVFRGRQGRPIEPPAFGPTAPRRPAGPATYVQPYGGPMATGSFSWCDLEPPAWN